MALAKKRHWEQNVLKFIYFFDMNFVTSETKSQKVKTLHTKKRHNSYLVFNEVK